MSTANIKRKQAEKDATKVEQLERELEALKKTGASTKAKETELEKAQEKAKKSSKAVPSKSAVKAYSLKNHFGNGAAPKTGQHDGGGTRRGRRRGRGRSGTRRNNV